MASQPLPMGNHMLQPAKGWSPDMNCLDYQAAISANVDYDMVPGQVAHLNSVGQLEPGVVAYQMPLFMFGGAASLDVLNSPGEYWWPVVPSGVVLCFPGTGGYEMWTTEFDTAQTYAINDPLRAPTGNTSGDVGVSGTLTNQGVLTWADFVTSSANLPTALVGICSGSAYGAPTSAGALVGPVYTNCLGYQVLSFWTIYHAGHPSET